VAAQFIGKQTRFASLEIGCERGAMAGNCDSGYSCAYSSSVSWASESTPVAKEVNPRAVFERLFGTGDEVADAVSRERRMAHRRSILDFVMEDADALRGRLGPMPCGAGWAPATSRSWTNIWMACATSSGALPARKPKTAR